MVLAVVVLLGRVAVLVVVVLLQPRAPYVAVRAASLYALVYGQTGALDDVQVTIRVEARNGNAHSAAYFSRLECHLAFAGATLAVLHAYPFRVPARGVLPPWPGVSVTDQDSGTANGFIVFFLVLDSFSY
ncbi:hypothetical protein ZEAMMB73_Zm00001d047052 [Zea mays]|uniref:Uncharacterized protein n=1 Tax=Zea mays TaxID=4577 RepID=A0A1D6P6K2_MAIZE|nr:hypothetical protein ZEAMMB73_Zm00001d047052 [Zea mays]